MFTSPALKLYGVASSKPGKQVYFGPIGRANEVGGPYWHVPLGRKDSKIAGYELETSNLPGANERLLSMISKFMYQGLSVTDLVALSGGHKLSKSTENVGGRVASGFAGKHPCLAGEDDPGMLRPPPPPYHIYTTPGTQPCHQFILIIPELAGNWPRSSPVSGELGVNFK
ncbi:hypothetical protein AgCh_012781 [Apium graveolens]